MDISGSYTLNAPREQVWDALLDPDLLKRAIPGCESFEQTGNNQYAMRLNVDVAGVKGVYQGTMRVLDAQKPESYRVVVDGAGARGILHSDGVLSLQVNDAGTTDIRYSGQAQLGGAVASIGAQVARGAASMLLKRYFSRIASLLPAVSVEPAAAAVASVAPFAPVAASVAAPPIPEASAPPAVAAPAEPPPTSAPADPASVAADAAPVAAPVEMFSTPAPAPAEPEPYAPPPPAAPVVEPPPPASPIPPVVPATAPAVPARAPLAVSSVESQRGSAGSIGAIIAILAVVVVVIVVLVVVGAFR
jgi:carbon monoxide dehydrogenase subunit G